MSFEHELKNAYIGEVYEYNYDFRNKTSNQIVADGWTYNNVPYFDANGMYYNTWECTVSKSIPSITNKVTVEGAFSVQQSGYFAIAYYLTNDSSGEFGLYADKGNTEKVRGRINDTNVYNVGTALAVGDYTYKLVLDLDSKTYNFSSPFTSTGSLTDTQTSAIQLINKIELLVAYPQIRLQTFSITIE